MAPGPCGAGAGLLGHLCILGPGVRVEVVSCRAGRAAGVWQVTWRIEADEPLSIEEAWVPHGRFRGLSRPLFSPPLGLPAEVTLEVRAAEAPGTVVENAFLILRVRGGRRVFVRMRIEFLEDQLKPICELVSLQSTSAPE